MIFFLATALFLAGSMACFAMLPRHRFIACVPALALCIPYAGDVILLSWPSDSLGSIDISYWTWCVSTGAAASFTIHSFLLIRFALMRLSIVTLVPLLSCFLLSFYFYVTVHDHIVFSRRGHGSVVVDLASLRSHSPLFDVSCDADRLLLSLTDTPRILYRCPTVTMLGSHTRDPFLPWPDYLEGESVDLKGVFRLLRPPPELERLDIGKSMGGKDLLKD